MTSEDIGGRAAPAPRPIGRRVIGAAAGVIGRVLFAAAWLWCVGAIWYSNAAPPFVAGAAAVGFAAVWPLLWYTMRARRPVVVGAFVAAVVLVGAIWSVKTPRNDRAWTRDMAVLPVGTFDGDLVHVAHVRHCAYESVDDFDVTFEDRTYDLTRLAAVHFLVEPVWEVFEGTAHTMLAFTFDDGAHVAISVELRREVGEGFNPIAGMFKEYELMYVIGDERDLIRLRTNHRRDEVYLYPIDAAPDVRRALFVDMIERANALAARPEFYHTFTNSCTTNIVAHVNRIVPGQVPFSYEVYLPGYSGRLAYELGLIDTELSFEETKRRCRIDERAQGIPADDPGFSARIRDHGPLR